MLESDDQNLVLASSTDAVDDVNSKFYGRFPYPWPPMRFTYLDDPDFERVMLNQDVGDWEHRVVPSNPRIWVAGCGTNQAVFTALRFPGATVLGSDISAASLEIGEDTARQLGITNLRLRQESINSVTYKEDFDYVICTGVIHHNADPESALSTLAAALKPTGVLELMVYNRYHRIATSAFQKAVRILGQAGGSEESGTDAGRVDFERELVITRRMIRGFSTENQLSQLLKQNENSPEAALADRLLQPVEYSYTVESLDAMASRCGLELILPCVNIFDKASGNLSWNMMFSDPELQECYNSLPDIRRWQVSNLLLLEKSPMLWFYLQRNDSGRPRKPVRQLCEEFMERPFVRAQTQQRSYIRTENGRYVPWHHTAVYPAGPSEPSVQAIVQAVDGKRPMRDVLRRLGIQPSFQWFAQSRLRLCTSAFPYLHAV